MRRFLDPKNDYVFRRLFGEDKNKDVLLLFLNDIFAGVHPKVEDVTFLKTHQNPEIAALRESIVDVLCRDAEGKQFIVEMQCRRDSGFIKRACLYASKAYGQQHTPEMEYDDLKPVIFLGIMKGKLFPQKKRYLLHYKLRELYDGECDIEEFTFSFLELGKINKTLEQSKTTIEKWAYFLKNAPKTRDEELAEIIRSYPPMERAYQALERSNYTEEEMLEYHRYAMREHEIATGLSDAKAEGLAEGEAKGKAEGEMKAKREMALSLHRQSVDKNIIATAAQLSPEEVEKILAEAGENL
jgi:predicted transposase/invertase (TIGR01784 family)